MAGPVDKWELIAEQLLQEAVAMNDAEHSPHEEPAASASSEGELGPHAGDSVGIAPDDSDLNSDLGSMDPREELLGAIDGIEAFGPFAAGGSLTGIMGTGTAIDITDPEIWIRDVGPIELPFDDVQARKITHTQRAQQTKPGGGHETAVDKGVRDAWELGPDDFDIRHASWGSLVHRATAWVEKQLGLGRGISAQLDRMMLYEKGSIPKPETDTDKPTGAFGTLTISLPSLHEGGDLVLQHGTESEVFKSSEGQGLIACWYSDVAHQVLPVTSGYRWVLTYNLIHPKGWERPSAQKISDQLSPLRCALRRWSEEPDYVFYVLEDQLTQQEPSTKTLDGRGGMRVRALEKVADSSACEVFLASLEKKTELVKADRSYENWYDEEDYNDIEDEDQPEGEAMVFMRDLVSLRGRKLISKYLFIDEEECAERILQGADAFDMADYDEESDPWEMYNVYRMKAVVVVPRQHAMEFFVNHMESPPSGPLLRYFAKKCCKPGTRAAALPVFKRAFQDILMLGGSRDALSDTLHVALSADAQLFNGFIEKAREPVPPTGPRVNAPDVTFGPREVRGGEAEATLSLHHRLATLNALVPSASDLSPSADEVRNWVLEMVAASIEDCRTSRKLGPDGEALVNMVLAFRGYDDFCTNLVPVLELRLDDRNVEFSLSALSAISKHISGGTMPGLEGVDTFRRLSRLLIEKLDIRNMETAPLPVNERPAKSARHVYDIGQTRAPLNIDDGLAVRPEALAGFLDDLIRTDSDEIIMRFGFKILGQIRGVSPQNLGGIWLPFLQRVLDILEAHSIPLSTTRYQCIFGGILDAYLENLVGKEPQAISGGSLRRRPVKCRKGRGICPECDTLNRFLADESQLHLRLTGLTLHQTQQLRELSAGRDCTYVLEREHPTLTWLVSKTPARDPRREHWENCCRHAQEAIRQVGQGKLAAVLGDTDYKRITTVSHLRRGPVAPVRAPDVPSTRILAPAAGNQRGTLPGVDTWGTGARPPPMRAVYGHPRPAPVAGVKRPAPPSEQVIDLTWMD